MNFSRNLKKLRKAKKLNQADLAKKLNVDIEKIRRYEQEKQKTIEIQDIYNLIEILDCDFNQLFK